MGQQRASSADSRRTFLELRSLGSPAGPLTMLQGPIRAPTSSYLEAAIRSANHQKGINFDIKIVKYDHARPDRLPSLPSNRLGACRAGDYRRIGSSAVLLRLL